MNEANIKSIKPIVQKLLTEYPHYRDDDRRLLAHIWMIQLGVNTMKSISLYEFMKQYIDNSHIYSPDHISRLRRKIQEQHPHLRGETYVERKRMQKDVAVNFASQ
jgi:hypothetical protein